MFKKTYIFNLLGKELEKILYEMIDKQKEGENLFAFCIPCPNVKEQ